MLKKKHSCVKPEDMVTFHRYSFSYNPEDQPDVQRFYCMKLLEYESWFGRYYDIFDSLKYSSVRTFVEISSQGRIHFHGYIKINDIYQFFFHDMKKLKCYGTFEIDQITDPLKWDLYIKKQKHFMEEFCFKNHIIYNFIAKNYFI